MEKDFLWPTLDSCDIMDECCYLLLLMPLMLLLINLETESSACI